MARLKDRIGSFGYFGEAGERAARTGLRVPETGFFGREFDVQDFQRMVSGARGAYQLGKNVYEDIIQPIKRDYSRTKREEQVAQARKDAAKKQLEMQKAQELQQEKSRVVAENKQLMGMMPEVPDVAMQEPTFGGGLTEPKPFSLREDPNIIENKISDDFLRLKNQGLDDVTANLVASAGRDRQYLPRPQTPMQLSVDMPGPISTAALRDFTPQEVVQINVESFRRAGVPSGPSTPEEADRVNDALNQIYAEIDAGVHPLSKGRTQQRPAQQTRFAPTGVPVSALQARASAAPTMAQAPAVAPQPRAMSGQDAQGAADAMLMKDPTNRAFVRSILRMQEMSGETKSLEAAMDLLRLELAKRGTPARDIVDVQAREVLTEDPEEASKRMTLSNVYNLASQSTVADWPKIEPLARQVIKRQGGYGFFEGPNVDEELEKIRKMLAGQTKAVPGVEFDLDSASKRARESAKSFKERRRRGGGKSSRSRTSKYLTNKDEKRSVGGKIIPVTIAYTNKRFDDLQKKIDSGKATEAEIRLRNEVLAERQMRNKGYGITDVKGVDPKDRSINLALQAQADYATAESLVESTKRAIREHSQNEPQQPKGFNSNKRSGIRYLEDHKRWSDQGKQLAKELRQAESKLKGASTKLPKETVSR
jgi:hypothetical protein